MAAQPQPLKYETRCRACGQIFRAAPLDIPVVGHADERLVKFVQALAAHIQKEHPDTMTLVAANIQEITGFLVLSVFESQDPSLTARFQSARYALQTATRQNKVTDETIQDKLAGLGLAQEEIEKVSPFIKDLRDFLCEEGSYKPKTGERKLVVQ